MPLKPLFSPSLPPLPKRPLDAHKTSVGSVCVVAGSYGMAGAAALAANAALAAGAGYVRVVCPARVYPILAVLVPSAVFTPLEDAAGSYPPAEIEKALSAAGASSACAIGPGLGESRAAQQLFFAVLAAFQKPLVIDASALNLLAGDPGRLGAGRANCVLTPHPGEAARLLGLDPQAVQSDRPAVAARLAAAFGCVAVLKGARTLVADAVRLFENTSGNAGMAKAGSGDVLAGAIAALLAQGLSSFDAACLGVYLHGKAGDRAARALGAGLSAGDLLASLPAAILAYEGRLFEKGPPR
jgi:NAD(P)H-hydrate epimerase